MNSDPQWESPSLFTFFCKKGWLLSSKLESNHEAPPEINNSLDSVLN